MRTCQGQTGDGSTKSQRKVKVRGADSCSGEVSRSMLSVNSLVASRGPSGAPHGPVGPPFVLPLALCPSATTASDIVGHSRPIRKSSRLRAIPPNRTSPQPPPATKFPRTISRLNPRKARQVPPSRRAAIPPPTQTHVCTSSSGGLDEDQKIALACGWRGNAWSF
jgi:hypothetical protein